MTDPLTQTLHLLMEMTEAVTDAANKQRFQNMAAAVAAAIVTQEWILDQPLSYFSPTQSAPSSATTPGDAEHGQSRN